MALAALVLMLAPVPSRAQEAEAARAADTATGAVEDTREGSDADTPPEEEIETPSGQPEIGPPEDVEVIRIKGRAVTAIDTDVPDSVTQFDASDIEALGAQNISDLAKVTPNVEITTAGVTAPTFFIRGVGLSDFSSNAAGAVAIYQDDVALNAPAIQLGQLFDLENVEVLRGPQGGGSGRNASAGAIKSYSRKPTGEFTAQLRSRFGTYASDKAYGDSLIQDYEGALEVPIVEELLATRLAFRFRDADPFMKNGCGHAPPFDQREAWTSSNTKADAQICHDDVRFNQVSQVPEGLPNHVGDQNNWAARGQLRLQPGDTDHDWLLNVHGSRLDQQSTLGQAVGTRPSFGRQTLTGYQEPDQQEMFEEIFNGFIEQGVPPAEARTMALPILADRVARNLDIRPYRGDYDRVGQTKLDSWGGFLRGDFALGPVNFTTLTGYDAYDRFRDTDQDFTPDVLFEAIDKDHAWQLTQELRFFGELEDTPLRWQAGGYYLMEQLHSNTDQFVNFSLFDTNRRYEQNLWSFAFYGNFSWDFLDDFTLEGGVRYNWERKDFKYNLFLVNLDIPFGDPVDTGKTWTAPTGTLSLKYRFREDVSAYWKYSRGWKGGQWNGTANLLEEVETPAKPETVDAFETGLRGSWLDGRIDFGGALFYYKYSNYQVFIFEDAPGSPPARILVNANDAETYGAEADVRVEPLAGLLPHQLDGLVLSGRFGWLESRFLDFTDTVFRRVPGTFEDVQVTADYSGNQLISSPKFKLSGAVEWSFDLGRWGVMMPRYDFSWTDDIFFDPTEGRGSVDFQGNPVLPPYAVGQRAYWLHNLRLGYRTPEGNIEIAAWVRNLEDKHYKTYAFDAQTFSAVVINFVGQPRTVGLDLSINF